MNLFQGQGRAHLQWMNEPEEWRFYSDQSLFIRAPRQSDFYCDPALSPPRDTAPFLFTVIRGDFEATVRLRIEAKRRGDAGDLMLMADANHWAKLCFESSGETSSVVSVVTKDGFSDDCNGVPISVEDPMLRIKKAGSCVSFSFSENDHTWSRVRTFAFPIYPEYRVGVVAQSPEGEGCEVTFETFDVSSPAATANL